MKLKENGLLRLLETFIDKSTKIAGFLVLLIVFAVSVQIFSRYGFNKFIREIVPLIQQSFAVFLLIGGLYVTSKGEHIRVTVLYDLFGPKMKRFAKVVSFLCMSIFLGILIWQSSWMGMNSLEHKETMNGIYKFMPMYPLKLFIPVMVIFILIVGVIYYFKTWNDDD
jgi:TRAP-type C4-dicarboxylate transport system permease small subunit